jgi:hypothetical protein
VEKREMKNFAVAALILALLPVSTIGGQQMPGLNIGAAAPVIHATDQFGKEQTIDSLMESQGLVLLFFRSADW